LEVYSRLNNRRLWFVVVGSLLLAGCGSSKYDTAEVSGTVRVNGKPKPDLALTFQPIGGGMASVGATDQDGRYTLEFYDSGDSGAIVAKHRVVIRTHRQSNTEDTSSDISNPNLRDPIPQRYNDNTELTMEVPAEGTDSADFDLKVP
jgi:hypothetical protein